MAIYQSDHSNRRMGHLPHWWAAVLGLGAVAMWAALGAVPAAAATTVNLATATPFAVLAGTTVTNTGPSTISGDLGVDPGSAVTGFPPGIVEPPSTTYAANSVALGAQNDLTTAYTQAAGEGPPTQEGADLTGLTLAPGVYDTSSDGALGLTGALTLNAEGDPNAVFIFQTGSTLTAGTSSTVSLIGGASACNVFWQVGSSATLNGPTFVGTVMALTTITLGSGVTVNGRVLARNGEVTLIDDTINASTCASTATPSPSPSPTITPGASATTTPTPTPSPSTTPGTRVPVPATGAGGTSGFGGGFLLLLGGLALIGASVAVAAIRRRRLSSTR